MCLCLLGLGFKPTRIPQQYWVIVCSFKVLHKEVYHLENAGHAEFAHLVTMVITGSPQAQVSVSLCY